MKERRHVVVAECFLNISPRERLPKLLIYYFVMNAFGESQKLESLDEAD